MIKKEISLPFNFEFRDYQKDAIKAGFLEDKDIFVLVWHRRAGKDITAFAFCLMKAIERVGTYLYLFPELKQARRNIWKGITSEGRRFLSFIPEDLIKHVDNSEMIIELKNGSMIMFGGSDRYDMLMGSNPIGIVFSEYSLQHPLAYQYLSPILAENKGWAFFIYTFRRNNHGYELYKYAKDSKKAFVQLLTVSDTKRPNGDPVVTDEDIEKFRSLGMSDGLIKQEFYCDPFAFNEGTIFAKSLDIAFKDNRILDFPIDNSIPVYCFWDLGYSDATAIWFVQFAREEIRLINYYENNHEDLPHYSQYIIDFRNKYNLVIADHYPPHDSLQRRLGTGKSIIELGRDAGIPFNEGSVVPRVDMKSNAISSARSIFNRCYFHKTNCKIGIDCLSEYAYKFDENHKVYSKDPVHNWASHGCDAFMGIALAMVNNMIPSQYLNMVAQYEAMPRVRL